MGLGGADAQGLPSLPERPGAARDEVSVRPAHLTAPLTSVALLPAATTLPYRLRRAGKPRRHRSVLGRPVSHRHIETVLHERRDRSLPIAVVHA